MAYDDFSIPTPTYRVPQRSRGMDAGTRRLAFIAAGLGAALLAIVGGYSAMHRHHGAVPVVTADQGPTRFKPDNPGGMEVAGAANEVFSGGSDTDVGKLAPPPETPAPQPRTAPAAPAQATTAQPVAPAAEPAKPPAKPTVVASAAKPAAVASAAKPPAVANAAKPATATQAAAKPAAVASTPAKPAAAAAASAKPTPVSTTATTTAASTKPEKTGKAAVQLAAFPTEDAAKAEWARLQKQMPDVFGGRQPALSKTEREGRTWWRLRTGGFADPTQAIQFCEHVRAKGATCSVADF